MILYDFSCPACDHTDEHLVQQPDSIVPCPSCGHTLIRHFPAPKHKPRHGWAETTTGSRDNYSDKPPGAMDTRPLADGMPLSEWKKQRREELKRTRYEQIKANT